MMTNTYALSTSIYATSVEHRANLGPAVAFEPDNRPHPCRFDFDIVQNSVSAAVTASFADAHFGPLRRPTATWRRDWCRGFALARRGSFCSEAAATPRSAKFVGLRAILSLCDEQTHSLKRCVKAHLSMRQPSR
jgi:hypothetical protein